MYKNKDFNVDIPAIAPQSNLREDNPGMYNNKDFNVDIIAIAPQSNLREDNPGMDKNKDIPAIALHHHRGVTN